MNPSGVDASSRLSLMEDPLLGHPADCRTMLQVGKLLTETAQSLCLVRAIAPAAILVRAMTRLEPGQPVAIGLRSSDLLAGSVERIDEDMALIRFRQPVALDRVLARQRRGGDKLAESVRLDVRSAGSIDVYGDRWPIELHDISLAGAKITDLPMLRIGMRLSLFVDGLPERQASIRWRRDGYAGMAFVSLLPFDLLSQWVLGQRPRIDLRSIAAAPAAHEAEDVPIVSPRMPL